MKKQTEKSLLATNEQLEKKLGKKEASLQKAKRDLKIEAALQQVRSVAMGMHKSEHLSEVSQVIFGQLKSLGFTKLRNTEIIINNDKKESVLSYYYSDYGVTGTIEIFYKNHPTAKAWAEQRRKANDAFACVTIPESEMEAWKAYRLEIGYQPEPKLSEARSVSNYSYSIGRGGLSISSFKPLTIEQVKVLKRFRNVFALSYQRYIDVAKAEAQAQEAKIEVSLERVRSKAMGMHSSEELSQTINVFFRELTLLGVLPWRCGVGRIDEDTHTTYLTTTSSTKDGNSFPVSGKLKQEGHPVLDSIYDHWKLQVEYFPVLRGNEIRVYYDVVSPQIGYPDYPVDAVQFGHFMFFKEGFVFAWTEKKLSEEQLGVFRKFTSVLSLTYRRYLDLKEAEGQAREAQIELGLERVRARAMAMQKSSELAELVDIVFKELTQLDFPLTRCVLWMMDTDAMTATTWMANPEINKTPDSFFIEFPDHPYYQAFHKGWIDRNPRWVYELKGAEKKALDLFVFNETGAKNLSDEVKNAMVSLERIFFSVSFHSFGALQADSLEPLSAASLDILFRFGKVFDLTYTRFNDLLKAEEQAREAQVEAALERVRSRTMAMQNSDELAELVATVFTELNRLEFALTSCIIWINNPELLSAQMWVASTELNEPPEPYYIKPFRHPYFKSVIDAWKQKNKKWVYEMKGEEKKHFQAAFFNEVGSFPTLIQKALEAPESVVYSASFYNFGAIEIVATDHITDEKFEILHRLGKVFDMSYTRFNDLKQAEAQARKARIEAALERVRGRTLAMQKSDELAETAAVLFQQFAALGILPDRIYIGTFIEEAGELECWVTDQGGNHISNKFRGKIDRPGFSKMYAAWKAKEKSLTLVQTGRELDEYIHFLRDELGLSFAPDRIWKQRVQNIGFFSKGLIGVTTPEIQPPETIYLVERFAAVFDLSYTRFLDLQKAEAQAREVVKRASIDRVRAEIASMRTTNDLEKITPLVWNELITLGVPFVRCGVFIMDDRQQVVHTFLSTPNGKAITAFHLQYEGPGELSQIILHWRRKEVYRQHWDETAFNNWTKNLELQGAIPSADTYLAENRFVDLDLHFLPFLQGMLYVGNEAPLSDDELHLVQNLADAFSTAYARYEDFNKLELAKKQIEQTLVDLRQTQAQLVQSEKMASLGELTAGIAHEIQNPLNFVNNFSEVSAELVEELNVEIEKGNIEDAKKIGEDLRQNLEKISHHGKRAGDIVKGMLMHSRTSSGSKESTDINALADEYLRLAYHGLRAKDKTFNTTMKSEYDASIGEINIIPQDIGRVILNLITNAFYAVDTRKKAQTSFGENGAYEPVVTIGSRSVTSASGTKWVLLTVKDNGIGMPQKILDKIFQPFFTTKPTGQGTGLGLSLSYDIVKAHGGEISVKTEEGMGSEFTIELPMV